MGSEWGHPLHLPKQQMGGGVFRTMPLKSISPFHGKIRAPLVMAARLASVIIVNWSEEQMIRHGHGSYTTKSSLPFKAIQQFCRMR
jgi:hypothetical protein